MKNVSLVAVIFLTAVNIYSVSAQENGLNNVLPAQYTDTTSANDSRLVTQYIQLSKYYLTVNTDSSLYWADRTISFALLKNNWHYLQYGLQARKQAEQSVIDMHSSQNIYLLDKVTQQNERINILIITAAMLLIGALFFLILYLRRGKNLKISYPDNDTDEHEEKIKAVENRLREVQQKNIDQLKEQKDLQEKYDNLQRINNIKDKLIPMIAHDIRSPLASLQNTLSLTRENLINPEEFQKLSFAIEADIFNLRGMLDNMLLWAKDQMFEIKITKSKFDLSEVFKDVILLYRNNLVAKNISLHNYMPPHIEVSTDKEIIAAVFRNLFSNAVKFTDPGKNIYISQVYLNGKIYISLKDEGKGILPETLQKLNNKEHITTRGTANEKGTGLGLVFCREMLLRLEEVFDIASQPDQGTYVTFSVNIN